MYIVRHPRTGDCRGERAVPAAGPANGLRRLQVWLGALPPGEHGTVSRHDGELVVLVLGGSGKLVVDGGPQRFIAPCTLLIPPGSSFEIVNNGTVLLELVSVFSAAPVPPATEPVAPPRDPRSPSQPNRNPNIEGTTMTTETFADREFTASHAAAPASTAPTAPRFDMYASIHKALRSFMCDTLLRAGRMDVHDPAELAASLEQIDTLLTFCLDHIDHENHFVHAAIEARRPTGAQHTADDHIAHLESIAALRGEVAALRVATPASRSTLAHRLYHRLALFVAENFQHMHVEETANNAALWALYSDAELHEIHDRLLATIPPAEELQIMRWMIPASSPTERAIVLGHVKAMTPPEAFLGVLAVVRPHLDDIDWAKLAPAVGVPVKTFASR